jgi:ribonucleoside-diphosphate reductase alpha chain
VARIRGGAAADALHAGQDDAPPCMACGAIMRRAGACYVCGNCGETGGCG